MKGFIPSEVLEATRLQVDIVEVIGEYTRLDKKGKDYIGLCPFHQEKTPSFTVSREKQVFYCFGCGVGGNVFKFLMLIENLSFPEAVRQLSKRVGIVIPDAFQEEELEKIKTKERAWEINALARDFYHDYLNRHPKGSVAREYLASRGISKDVQERFKLGYAPDGWDKLINYLIKHNYSISEITIFGLAVKGENGKAYDRFRHRIIFPICNIQGKVIGFGARSLGDAQPKYLNSPETIIFNKRNVLYGLDLARLAIREKGFAVIMEGYMDVIAAHQFGLTNAVASLGTSLTEEQCKLLLRYTSEVKIAYDADAAGIAATLRGLDLLQEFGCRVHVITIPEGEDPDEYIRIRGLRAWESLMDQAQTLIEYKIYQASQKTSDKSKILQYIIPNLVKIANPVEQEESIKIIASRLNLSWETIKSELKRFQRKKWPISDKIANKMHNIITRPKLNAIELAEQEILRLILQKPDYMSIIEKELGKGFPTTPAFKKIFLAFYQDDSQDVLNLMQKLDVEEQKILSRLLIEDTIVSDDALNDYIQILKAYRIKLQRTRLLQELAEAEKKRDQEEVSNLLKQIQQLL